MKYLIILVILLAGCAPLKYYPKGSLGTAVPYYSNASEDLKCHRCDSTAYLFKKDSKDRVICDVCYRKLTY